MIARCNQWAATVVASVGLVIVVACDAPAVQAPDAVADALPGSDAAPSPSWPFPLPTTFPVPRLPPNTPFTPALAELGRHLFYDVRLSANQTTSCASCHLQAKAFTDGRVTPVGATGQVLRRNASTLTNAVYNPAQTWANPILTSFEKQALVPIFGEHPVELGVTGHESEILARFIGDSRYQALFAAAFPAVTEPVTMPNVVAAISAFERRLISGNSRVDQYRQGNAAALNDSERRGLALFFDERFECHHCHGGFNFTIAVDYELLPQTSQFFFNTGLYNIGAGAYPIEDQGLWEVSLVDADKGRFRPPTLRNIAVTAPYMHDGSVATLEEVLAIYERGGRLITGGPNAGDGRLNPNKNGFVAGFEATPQERADLLAFLRALTDESFLVDPTIANPWQ